MTAEGKKKKKQAHNFDRQEGPFMAKQQTHPKTDDKDVSQRHLLKKLGSPHWNGSPAEAEPPGPNTPTPNTGGRAVLCVQAGHSRCESGPPPDSTW